MFAEAVAAWHIFVYIFMNGAVRTLRMVIESSLIPNIVPGRLMTNGFSLFMLTGSFTRFIVPAMTGVAIGIVGSGPTMAVSLVLYILALVAGLRIQLKEKASKKPIGGSPANDLVEGLMYLAREKRILAIYILPAMLMLFIAPVNMGLMPVYVAEVFEGGPDTLGFIIGALGAGMTFGTLLLASLGDIRFKARAMTFACIGTGCRYAYIHTDNLSACRSCGRPDVQRADDDGVRTRKHCRPEHHARPAARASDGLAWRNLRRVPGRDADRRKLGTAVWSAGGGGGYHRGIRAVPPCYTTGYRRIWTLR